MGCGGFIRVIVGQITVINFQYVKGKFWHLMSVRPSLVIPQLVVSQHFALSRIMDVGGG